jgi:hypothetical protein
VKFEAVGPPILTASCYCTSCQEAGRQFEQLASAPPVLDFDSGTALMAGPSALPLRLKMPLVIQIRFL